MNAKASPTWFLIALATLIFVGTGTMLGLYLDTRPVVHTPGPETTVTETHTTTAKPEVRTKTETVPGRERTRTVPGPTVTVTETVPGPEVTVTETVTETATPSPMVLNLDTAMAPEWQVAEAAEIWNTALGCEVFVTEVPSVLADGQRVSWVTQVETGTLMLGDDHVRALYSGDLIQFDAIQGVEAYVAVHELGHALGLLHGDGAGSIMNVALPDRELPSADDVAQALENQVALGRCKV